MEQETTTPAELLQGLRRRWPLVLLVLLPLWSAVVLYAERLPDLYQSTSVVALTPREDVEVGGDILRVVIPKYVAFLSSRPALSSTGASTGLDPDDLRGGVDVSVAPETANLEITVELQSASAAQQAAAALAAAAVELSQGDRLLTAEVLVPAVQVDQPSGPPRRLLEAGGLVLALIAGVTLALLVDRSQPTVASTGGLARVSGLRALAALPRSRRLRQRPHEALEDPVVSAAVGSLLVQVDAESRIQPVRVLGVTSPSPGDGKTTVAAVLATGLARLDARVLLLDADLRKPRVASHLGLDLEGPGLVDVLDGRMALADVALPHVPATLSVVRTVAHRDASNLLTRRLQAVLATAADSYDIVIVDCPPVLATDDALVVSVMCDAVLLVVDGGSREVLTAAASSTLVGLNVRLLGAVLNRARAGVGGTQAYGSYGRR